MATATPNQEEHNQTLERLCRICAGFLTKFSDVYERSHSCAEKEKKNSLHRILESTFQRMTLKFIPLDSVTFVTCPQLVFKDPLFGTFILIRTLSHAILLRKKKKGGRPKKPKRGKKNFKTAKNQETNYRTTSRYCLESHPKS